MLTFLRPWAVGWLIAVGILVLASPAAHAQRYYPGLAYGRDRSELVRVLLNSRSWEQRAEAAQLLGSTGDPSVLQALTTAATYDRSPQVRDAAADAIARIRFVGGQDQGRWDRPGGRGGDPYVEMVQSWYQRYLHRSSDPGGLDGWVRELRQGASPEVIQAAIIGSPEYFEVHGGTPAGFIMGLYDDILGRTANRDEIHGWLDRLHQYRGQRDRVAAEFFREAQAELQGRQGGYFPWR